MESQRIQVKIYATESQDPERFIPVFHRFIRDSVFDELMIDVADYGHVKDGPGVVLIGHASDYFADTAKGASVCSTRESAKLRRPPSVSRTRFVAR